MANDSENRNSAKELRRKAEEKVASQPASTGELDTKRLLHELQVHQVELEMQYAEILQSRDDNEALLNKYSDLYEFAPVGYCTLQPNGKILNLNLRVSAILGINRSQLNSKAFAQYVVDTDRPAFAEFLNQVFSSKTKQNCELELLSEAGNPLFVQLEAVASAAGTECHLAVIDITERKQAAEQLAKKKSTFQSLLESIPDATVFVDQERRIIDVNEAFTNTFGYTLDELRGKMTSVFYESDEEYLRQGRLRYNLSPEQAKEPYNVSYRRKDGSIFPGETVGAKVFTQAGDVMGFFGLMRDVSEKVLLEGQLKQERALLRSVIDSADDLIYFKDRNSTYIGCNKAFEKFTGIAEREQIGKTDYDFFDPAIAEKVVKDDQKVIESHTSVRTEEWVASPAFGTVLLETVKAPIYSPDGQPPGLVAISRDVTERKKAEQALESALAEKSKSEALLQASEAQTRAMLEQAPMGIALIDSLSGQLYEINQRFADIVGRSREDLLALDWMTITHPDDIQPDLDNMARLNAGEISGFNMQKRYIHADSSIVWISLTIAPIKVTDKNRPRHLAMVEDITEKRLAEEALCKSNKDLRLAQRIAQIGNWAFDPETGAHEWSDEIYRIYGRDPEVGPYSVAEYQKILKGESLEIFTSAIQRAIHEGQPYDIELKHELVPGNVKWVRAICEPEPKAGSKEYFLRGTIQDITERKHAEKESEILKKQLLQAQKMEAMGNLVGGIAHNFNNALAGITGNLYLAKKNTEDLPKVVEKLNRAEKLAFQTGETIQQLLSFTRKGIMQTKPIPVAPFLRETLELQQIAIPENISLHVEVDEELSLVVKGDVSQLQQVLMNLIINARDAVKDVKHPSISIKLSKFYADKEYLNKHPYVHDVDFACISVRDNGCGIVEQDLQRIFEPFFSTKGVGRGTGLGLSMAFGAIKSHGGHIEVSSVPSKGSLFEIYLPIYASVEAVLPKNTGDEIILGNREQILLADDNEMVLEIGKALLEELNYRVLTAKDGQEAVATYRACKDVIDLLVLDVVMPKMGGVEALRIIRQEDPEVKAIFCTGYDKLDAVTEDQCVSLESVITKPFSISELSQKLKSTLG